MPAAGSISKRVTTGPWATLTTLALTPKSWSFNSSNFDLAFKLSSEYISSSRSTSENRSSGGNPMSSLLLKSEICFYL